MHPSNYRVVEEIDVFGIRRSLLTKAKPDRTIPTFHRNMSTVSPSSSGSGAASPLSLQQVLVDEYRLLHGVSAADTQSASTTDANDADRLAATLRAHATAGHAALCLSGGGIR